MILIETSLKVIEQEVIEKQDKEVKILSSDLKQLHELSERKTSVLASAIEQLQRDQLVAATHQATVANALSQLAAQVQGVTTLSIHLPHPEATVVAEAPEVEMGNRGQGGGNGKGKTKPLGDAGRSDCFKSEDDRRRKERREKGGERDGRKEKDRNRRKPQT